PSDKTSLDIAESARELFRAKRLMQRHNVRHFMAAGTQVADHGSCGPVRMDEVEVSASQELIGENRQPRERMFFRDRLEIHSEWRHAGRKQLCFSSVNGHNRSSERCWVEARI